MQRFRHSAKLWLLQIIRAVRLSLEAVELALGELIQARLTSSLLSQGALAFEIGIAAVELLVLFEHTRFFALLLTRPALAGWRW